MKIAFAIIGEAHAASTTAADNAVPAIDGNTESLAASHTETGVAESGHAGAFPPFDPTFFASQLFWLAITFGLMYLLMSRLALPRVGAIIEIRQNRIRQDLDEAGRLKDESDAAHTAYEKELSDARNRAHAIGLKARDEAKAVNEAERTRVEAELGAKLGAAESRIAAVKAKALSEVGRIAAETTSIIVSELLGISPSAAEIASAIGNKR